LFAALLACGGCGGAPPDAQTPPRDDSQATPDAAEPPAAPVPPSAEPQSPGDSTPAPAAPEKPSPLPKMADRVFEKALPENKSVIEMSAAEPPDDEVPREKVFQRAVPEVDAQAADGTIHRVDVFYATDRLPAQDLDPPGWMARYGPVVAAGVITLFFGIGALLFSRRILPVVLAFGCLLLALSWYQAQQIDAERRARLTQHGNRIYGNARHETPTGFILELGRCEVTLPPQHSVGKLEAPSIFKLEFRETPEKHVMLQRIVCLPEQDFFHQLHDYVAGSKSQQAMVFVHGYNVSFDNAVRRTAQIAHDLEFDGAPICYSWPSLGGLSEYTRDENNVEWTALHLEQFLNRVVAESGATTIHLVAHSMGNRALLQALERMLPRRQESTPLFGQIVLAAPDVDAAAFRERYAPATVAMAHQVTLYASSSDRALLASTKVHGQTRAGLAGEHLLTIPGVQTIDVSAIDTSFLGHSYYGNNPLLIKDLRAIVELGHPASARAWLQEILRPPSPAWWSFKAADEKQVDDKPEEL
jgi:esterase/lipase superfamily enzyme